MARSSARPRGAARRWPARWHALLLLLSAAAPAAARAAVTWSAGRDDGPATSRAPAPAPPPSVDWVDWVARLAPADADDDAPAYAFVCPPSAEAGCAARAADENECAAVGARCGGDRAARWEHCCVDACGRRYCTAKGSMVFPALARPGTTAAATAPTRGPAKEPTRGPTAEPTRGPTAAPTTPPTTTPTEGPTAGPTAAPTTHPTPEPTRRPTDAPTAAPARAPSPRQGTPQTHYVCPPAELVGCTAPDLSVHVDECAGPAGAPCAGRPARWGERCCVDACARRYCTAKGALREGAPPPSAASSEGPEGPEEWAPLDIVVSSDDGRREDPLRPALLLGRDGAPPAAPPVFPAVDGAAEDPLRVRAVNDRATTFTEQALAIDVLANDRLGDGDGDGDGGGVDALFLQAVVVDGVHGRCGAITASVLLYVPDPGYAGPDKCGYRVCHRGGGDDGDGDTCDYAAVSVTVAKAQEPLALAPPPEGEDDDAPRGEAAAGVVDPEDLFTPECVDSAVCGGPWPSLRWRGSRRALRVVVAQVVGGSRTIRRRCPALRGCGGGVALGSPRGRGRGPLELRCQ